MTSPRRQQASYTHHHARHGLKLVEGDVDILQEVSQGTARQHGLFLPCDLVAVPTDELLNVVALHLIRLDVLVLASTHFPLRLRKFGRTA